MQRLVKLERDPEGQLVQIPPEFEPAVEDLIIRKEGDKLIVEPAAPKQLLKTLEPLDEKLAQIEPGTSDSLK